MTQIWVLRSRVEKQSAKYLAFRGQDTSTMSKEFLLGSSKITRGRISDLLKFLVPKVGESFVLDHNVESQEVAQARPRPELAGALETILELAAL